MGSMINWATGPNVKDVLAVSQQRLESNLPKVPMNSRAATAVLANDDTAVTSLTISRAGLQLSSDDQSANNASTLQSASWKNQTNVPNVAEQVAAGRNRLLQLAIRAYNGERSPDEKLYGAPRQMVR